MYIVNLINDNEVTEVHGHSEKLIAGNIVKGINSIDSFSFSMLMSNKGFYKIRELKTLVTVYDTIKERFEFFGRVLKPTDTMTENGLISIELVCESFFGFLCDSKQPYQQEQNWTVRGLFEHIINNHNAQVEEYKRFKVGAISVTDVNENIFIGIQRENTWETIGSKLIEKLGGEIRFRVEEDGTYIDYLKEIGNVSKTEIALSRNMKSITKEKDPTEFVTRLIPLGCKLSETAGDGTTIESERRLDITSVNGGCEYIDDEEAMAEYGIIVDYAYWDDVTEPSNLLRKGKEYLAENNRVKIKYSITALDLSLLGLDIDNYEVGNYYPIKNALLRIEDTARIVKKNINICEPNGSSIEVGDNFKTLSDIQYEQTKAFKNMAINFATSQQVTSAQKNAIDNATALITTAMGGYVVKTNDELLIMDTDNIQTARKVWRWNINGLAYSDNGYNGEYALAMTMDGQIVADFIATGTMYADRIKGGILKLGGNDNENGILLIVDKNGNTVGRCDKDGITLPEGTSIAWKDIKDIPSDIVDMQIGGTNLLRNTKDFASNWWGNNTKLGAVADPFGGMDAYAFKGTKENNSYLIQNNVFKRSGKYVASFWAKASQPYELYVGGSSFRVEKIMLTTEWQKYELPFEATITDAEWWCFGSYATWNDTETEIYLYHPKVEEGTVSTAWSPSPNDIVAKGEVSAQISNEDGDISIKANRFSWEATNSSLTKEGLLTAKNGSLSFENANGDAYQINSTGITGRATKSGYQYPYIKMYNDYTNRLLDIESGSIYWYELDTADDVYRALAYVNYLGQASFKETNVSSLWASGDITCQGTKSRLSTTENYNNRLLYCYEMPTPYFGDIGEGQLDESGICYVYIDDVFIETIDTSCNYQVFLQKYGEGELIVAERKQGYFVVKGTPNLAFAWELKAKQAGYTMQRLEEPNRTTYEENEVNYESEANLYLTNYEKEILNYA